MNDSEKDSSRVPASYVRTIRAHDWKSNADYEIQITVTHSVCVNEGVVEELISRIMLEMHQFNVCSLSRITVT